LWIEVLFEGKLKGLAVLWMCAGVVSSDPAAQGIKLGALVGEAAVPTRINVRTSYSARLLKKGNSTTSGEKPWKEEAGEGKKKRAEVVNGAKGKRSRRC
jgi:hypothetical protein